MLSCVRHGRRSLATTIRSFSASSSSSKHSDGGTVLEGKVALWGNGDFGRLGNGGTSSAVLPTVALSAFPYSAQQVACGGAHTVILRDEGRVFSMGLNDSGQIGQPLDIPHSPIPLEVQGLPGRVIHVAAGHRHTTCITEEGDIWTWGSARLNQLGLHKKGDTWQPCQVEALAGARAVQVACGAEHTLALTESGEVYSWGNGRNGRLGHGPQPLFQRMSGSIEALPRLVRAFDGVKVEGIAAGHQHSACIDAGGDLFTFGYGSYGQLGTGDQKDMDIPTQVGASVRFSQVSLGGNHTAAVSYGGALLVWGANEHGCLGFGKGNWESSRTPRVVEGPLHYLTVTQVSCGWKHTAAITEDGKLWTCGWGGSHGSFTVEGSSTGGQLGLGNEFDYLEPTQVKTCVVSEAKIETGTHEGEETRPLRVRQVACGFNHTAAVLSY